MTDRSKSNCLEGYDVKIYHISAKFLQITTLFSNQPTSSKNFPLKVISQVPIC